MKESNTEQLEHYIGEKKNRAIIRKKQSHITNLLLKAAYVYSIQNQTALSESFEKLIFAIEESGYNT